MYNVFSIQTYDALVLSVHVAVIYFLFLTCIYVLAILLTIMVHRLQRRSEAKSCTAMPIRVSSDNCVHQI